MAITETEYCSSCEQDLTAENTTEGGKTSSDPYGRYPSEPMCDTCIGRAQDAYLDRINEM